MKAFNRSLFLSLAIIWMTSFVAAAQGQVAYTLAPDPELKIIGKSTIRVWKMTSRVASGHGIFQLEGDKIVGIDILEVQMQAESLTSGTKGLDRHAYESLDTSRFPIVKFSLQELKGVGDSWEARGDFIISGVTRQVVFPVKIEQIGNQVNFQGEIPIKFSDFEIVTPTNFFGIVKTHDDARILFNTTFQPKN